MKKETRNFPALMIWMVRRAGSRIKSLIFGAELAYLPEWFFHHCHDQHVETHITLQNGDHSVFIMPCTYNLN
jgi:hypothetical protein